MDENNTSWKRPKSSEKDWNESKLSKNGWKGQISLFCILQKDWRFSCLDKRLLKGIAKVYKAKLR